MIEDLSKAVETIALPVLPEYGPTGRKLAEDMLEIARAAVFVQMIGEGSDPRDPDGHHHGWSATSLRQCNSAVSRHARGRRPATRGEHRGGGEDELRDSL
jgi:hypothetical protein